MISIFHLSLACSHTSNVMIDCVLTAQMKGVRSLYYKLKPTHVSPLSAGYDSRLLRPPGHVKHYVNMKFNRNLSSGKGEKLQNLWTGSQIFRILLGFVEVFGDSYRSKFNHMQVYPECEYQNDPFWPRDVSVRFEERKVFPTNQMKGENFLLGKIRPLRAPSHEYILEIPLASIDSVWHIKKIRDFSKESLAKYLQNPNLRSKLIQTFLLSQLPPHA